MFSKDLKQLLDEKYLEYNKSEFFIETKLNIQQVN